MTHEEAEEMQRSYLYLKGQSYKDTKKNQVDTITDIIITPQDHPFFPEFLGFYVSTGSYREAMELTFQKHQDEIIYSVKCVLDEVFDLQKDVELFVLADIHYVLRYTS